MNLQQQRLEFLQDTINYYSEDTSRRAVVYIDEFNECRYLTEDGRKCAIGRVINISYEDSEKLSNVTVANSNIVKLLPEHIKVLGIDFLSRIQRLHNCDTYWNEDGLSAIGKETVTDIIKEYCTIP